LNINLIARTTMFPLVHIDLTAASWALNIIPHSPKATVTGRFSVIKIKGKGKKREKKIELLKMLMSLINPVAVVETVSANPRIWTQHEENKEAQYDWKILPGGRREKRQIQYKDIPPGRQFDANRQIQAIRKRLLRDHRGKNDCLPK
jgi:hypothetical protein